MQGQYIERTLEKEVIVCLRDFPAVAILGPRQCGKSTPLAGRIAYLELTPLLHQEILPASQDSVLTEYWMRGGFPDSFLAQSDESSRRWRDNFIRTFLERDIPQFGFFIPAMTLRRVWQICAHNSGQIFNASKLGTNIGASHTTMKKYIDVLTNTFMLRILPPFTPNIGKRLVKSPKIYLRDTGILHALLRIDSFDDLLDHPALGASWETLVLENVITALPGWDVFFSRTAAGAEIDLVLTRGQRKLAVECKASAAPQVNRGFWIGMEDLGIETAWVIAPIQDAYPIARNVTVSSLHHFNKAIVAINGTVSEGINSSDPSSR